jgi:hypothetical protein
VNGEFIFVRDADQVIVKASVGDEIVFAVHLNSKRIGELSKLGTVMKAHSEGFGEGKEGLLNVSAIRDLVPIFPLIFSSLSTIYITMADNMTNNHKITKTEAALFAKMNDETGRAAMMILMCASMESGIYPPKDPPTKK